MIVLFSVVFIICEIFVRSFTIHFAASNLNVFFDLKYAFLLVLLEKLLFGDLARHMHRDLTIDKNFIIEKAINSLLDCFMVWAIAGIISQLFKGYL